jgi:plasmid stabilization system protein ParE
MIRRIEWSVEAGRDFEGAMEYIAVDSEASARLVAIGIWAAVERLSELPTGHPGRVKGTYEKLVQKTPYIIAYSLTDETVNVLRIVHGARDWPGNSWPAN